MRVRVPTTPREAMLAPDTGARASDSARKTGLLMVGAALGVGAIDLYADSFALAASDRFGWAQGTVLFAAGLVLIAGLVIAYVPRSLISPLAIARATGTRPARALFILGFAAGIVVRLVLLRHYGTQDPGSDLDWGTDVVSSGLAASYHGNYFPLQYQVFGGVVALADQLGAREIVVFKTVNLVCDLLIFWLIAALLRSYGRNPGWALLYWLTPYVMALDWLGYVDFQTALFVLLALVVIRWSASGADWLVAGIPLGVALLLKPQTYALLAALTLFVVCRVVITKRLDRSAWQPALAFIAPLLMIAVYSAYLGTHGRRVTYLLDTYAGATHLLPSLSSNSPNMWQVVAQLQRGNATRLYEVTTPSYLHPVSQALTIVVLAAFALLLARRFALAQPGPTFLVLFTAAALTVPMTATQAHENHLLIGAMFATLLIPIVAVSRLALVTLLFLFVQFLNVFALYGFDQGVAPINRYYTATAVLALAVGATILYVLVVWSLLSAIRTGRVEDLQAERSSGSASAAAAVLGAPS